MKNKILKLIIIILLFQSITISNVFAVLSPELEILYFMKSLNFEMFIVEFILLIITIIKKKKINSVFAFLYLIWFVYIMIMSYVSTYIVDTNVGILLYTMGALLGIIMIVYTLKRIFEKSLKGDK